MIATSTSSTYTPEVLNSLVTRVFAIDDFTLGDAKQNYIMRYRGHLLDSNSSAAYDRLSGLTQPYGITPLFRNSAGSQEIILVPSLNLTQSRTWINLVLLGVTIVSVVWTGANYSPSEPLNGNLLHDIGAALPFAASLMAILLAHEFGHYLVGRYHKAHVSLPYFLPLPFPISPFGTMGAFINMKEPPKNRSILLDIGIAGPLAGLIVAIPVLLYGLSISTVDRIPSFFPPGTGISFEGNSLLYLLAKFAVFKQWLPLPLNFGGLPPLLYWTRYFFTGQPLPLGGLDVTVSPVAWAGWAGILVTSLNLIPAGQLDGGHMLYVLVGARGSRRILPLILAALVVLGFFWSGWWLWAFLIFLLGRYYAEPLDQITPLDGRRKALAVLALFIFVLVFTPIPLAIVGG